MEFRAFRAEDGPAVIGLFRTTFSDSEGEQEGRMVSDIVHALIATDGAGEVYGFVAADGRALVAAVFFSRLRFAQPVEAFILSPMAVRTDRQGQGIGQALIRHGLQALRETGVALVMTYGDPAFYARVGFRPLTTEVVPAPFALSQPHGWLGQSLTGGTVGPVEGPCSCVPALADPACW
jgi:predicted N-acetyltransferase YhbS